jgi:AraC-like DNA-binding protein
MSPLTARLPLAPYAPPNAPVPRFCRPVARKVADIVRVEERGVDVQPRMHPWFGISLVRSTALISVESRRDIIADRNWIVLIPSFELHWLRALGDAAQGAVTLLLGGSCLAGLELPTLPALVTDPTFGERAAALIAQVQEGRSAEQGTTIRSLLEQLLLCSIPLTPGNIRPTPLARVRTFLQTNVNESVSTGELARMSVFSETHLIHAFHYEFGLPPHAYHLRRRLAAACEALAQGMAVASVAYEFGFADQSHLSRKFKAVYGVTPAAWAAASPRTLLARVSSR